MTQCHAGSREIRLITKLLQTTKRLRCACPKHSKVLYNRCLALTNKGSFPGHAIFCLSKCLQIAAPTPSPQHASTKRKQFPAAVAEDIILSRSAEKRTIERWWSRRTGTPGRLKRTARQPRRRERGETGREGADACAHVLPHASMPASPATATLPAPRLTWPLWLPQLLCWRAGEGAAGSGQ